ncbi:MAG TPA: peroxiredoxin [Clostridiales bacterium]|jgi:peroxiredoxin (alkyl hydroperoxide reductase subunit C)|nr:peroxiredoxin [Clostridiales bacterium]
MEEKNSYRMPLLGDMAPAFHAVTTQGEIDFPKDYYGRWIVLFSHPADFTPVCTTEFITFASMINEFKALNTELVGLSIDSIYSHIAWLRKIKELSWKDMKHVEVTFPLIADITMDIARKYGMLHPNTSNTQTVRAVFIIDPEGIIRAILYYPLTTGRNMEEIKRILIALQKSDRENVATPANWMPCDDVILPAPGTCGAAKERVEKISENTYCLDWFLCFLQTPCGQNDFFEPEGLPYPSSYHYKNKYYRR